MLERLSFLWNSFMLQKLNDRIQGVVTWVIVGLVTVTFTLFGLSYYIQSRQDTDIKVQVNDQRITKQAFELNYRRMSQMQNPNSLTTANEKALKQQVLSEMIVNAASVAAAHLNGFEIDNHQATSAILLIPQFQEDGHFSTSRYTQALTNAFFTPQTFQQEVRQGMLLNQQRFALIGTAFVLPGELEQFVRLSMQTRDYAHAFIKASEFNDSVVVSSEEIQDYYNRHKNKFCSKEQVSVAYIRLSLKDIKQHIKLPPEMVVRYYQDNKTDYLKPARWKLAYIRFPLDEQMSADAQETVKQRVNNLYQTLLAEPQKFDTLAEQLSAEKIAEHGIAPVVIAGQSDLDQQLVNLTQPGQMSAPIRTKLGYELFRLIAYKPATAKPFSRVKPLIVEQLIQERAQKRYSDMAERLIDLSYQNPDSLDLVADSLKMSVAHTNLFSREGGEEELTKNATVVQEAFSQDVMVYGNNSEPIALDTDDVVVLRIQQHIPAVLQTLDQVKDRITTALIHKKATEAAHALGQQIIARTASEAALKWHAVHDIGRDSDTGDNRINELAFGLAHVGDYDGASLTNGDFALVKLLQVSDGKMDELDKEQVANVIQQIEASYGLMDYDLYVNRLMDQAKIVKH